MGTVPHSMIMRLSPITLLRDRDSFWADAKAQRLEWVDLLPLAGFIILACGLYGAVLAGWRSPTLSMYVAVKLPLLFLATMLLVSLFNWMLASLLGADLRFKTTVFLVVVSMTVASWILLSLTPVALLFVMSGVPCSGTNDELRYAHNCILMTHISILAIAGVVGNSALLGGLRRLVSPRCHILALFFSWLGAFAFVGCQMSWILRPFVGSPFYPIVFMRPDCLDRNFYEFVFMDVLPYLLTGGK